MLYIEAIFCLLEIAVQISEPVTQNFVRYRTCTVTLGYNETECALLGTKYHDNKTDEIEKATDPYVTVLHTTRDLTDALVSIFMCLFLGSWSDKYGRKPVLVGSLAGYTLSYLIITIVVSIPKISPWFLLLSTIARAITGGFPILLSSTVSYMAETTTEANKGLRLGIFEVLITIAGMLGTTASSFIFNACGYTITYLITTVLLFFTFWTMAAFVSESIPNPQPLQGCTCQDLFNFSLVKKTATTTFKRRLNNDRALLLLTISIIVIYFLAVSADDKLVFLYLSTKLHLSLQQYSLYLTARRGAWIAGSLVGVLVLHKLIGVKEGFLIALGMVSMMVSALLQGIGFKDWHIYVGGGSRCFGSVISPMTRSLIAKLTPDDDIGKVFSFTVICETLIQFVGRPIYTYIYNNTLNVLPGAFNFVTVGIYIMEIILTVPLIILYRRRYETEPLYENISEEDSPEENVVNAFANEVD